MKRAFLTLLLGLIPAAVPNAVTAHERDGRSLERERGGSHRSYEYRPHEYRRDYDSHYGGYSYDRYRTYTYVSPYLRYDSRYEPYSYYPSPDECRDYGTYDRSAYLYGR